MIYNSKCICNLMLNVYIRKNVLSICDLVVFVGGVGVDVEVDVVVGIG